MRSIDDQCNSIKYDGQEGTSTVAIFVTGGARSGKSHFAEQLATRKHDSGIYIATSEALDDEMAERIRKHQADRISSGFDWDTVEVPLQLSDKLRELGSRQSDEMSRRVVLVDCLTLWLSNWFFALEAKANRETMLQHEIERLAGEVSEYPYPLIIVSNEVGDGIVPMDALSRQYRDAAGRLNQAVARHCEQAFLVTAGIPIDLKRFAFQWNEL